MSLFIKKNGKVFGPFTRDDVSDLLIQALFTETDHISDDRLNWISLEEYKKRLKDQAENSSASGKEPATPKLKPVKAGTPVLKPVKAGTPVLKPVGPAMQNPAPMMRNMMPQGQPIMQPMMSPGTKSGSPLFTQVSLVACLITLLSVIIVAVIDRPLNPVSQVFSWIFMISTVVAVVFSAMGIKKSGSGGWFIASIIILVLSSLFLIFLIIGIFLYMDSFM